MREFYQNNLIEFSLLKLNKPYIFGARGPDTFDNAGFTYHIFHELFGIDIEEHGYGIDNTTKQITSNIGKICKYKEDDPHKKKYIATILPGDLLFFHTSSKEDTQPTPNNRYPGHVGIYLGDNYFIHADPAKGMVTLTLLEEKYLDSLVASIDILSNVKATTIYKKNEKS